jgi:hypothetical protein
MKRKGGRGSMTKQPSKHGQESTVLTRSWWQDSGNRLGRTGQPQKNTQNRSARIRQPREDSQKSIAVTRPWLLDSCDRQPRQDGPIMTVLLWQPFQESTQGMLWKDGQRSTAMTRYRRHDRATTWKPGPKLAVILKREGWRVESTPPEKHINNCTAFETMLERVIYVYIATLHTLTKPVHWLLEGPCWNPPNSYLSLHAAPPGSRKFPIRMYLMHPILHVVGTELLTVRK